ncbi:MAG TPA: DUF929 family protein [Propionibacterium sp.]|nr:DUF929 family protein [Propionibacterium sp.]
MAKAGKPSGQTSRAQLAEQRRQAEAAARRNKMFGIAAGAVALLLVVVGVIIALGMNRDRTGGGETGGSGYVAALQNVPAADLDAVGVGALPVTPAQPIPGGEVQMVDGKPRLLYIGAEYCSFCGYTRWPLTIALERFGDFSGLAAGQAPSNTGMIPTVSYKDATYTSDHLVFKGYELKDAQGNDIQTLTPEDEAIARDHGMQGYPWLYWGTHTSGTPFLQPFLQSGAMPGKSGDAIAEKLKDTGSDEAQAILGAANVTTAQICALTGDQPGDVCSAPGVVAAKAVLG